MILDTSAIIAILKQEPEAAEFSRAIEAAEACRMSMASFVEAAVVIDSKGDPKASRKYDDMLRDAKVELVSVDETQARIAREAYRDFGKGSGHAAQLNFGDCFAYALAKATGEPLLFKGNDFSHTESSVKKPD
ncbi:MAG: type II toxin-antitoxin system VapC family toxin [Rhizomicrobium sp.]